jgi:hypothetical protein
MNSIEAREWLDQHSTLEDALLAIVQGATSPEEAIAALATWRESEPATFDLCVKIALADVRQLRSLNPNGVTERPEALKVAS